MASFSRFTQKRQTRRVCCIGLDGTPYGLIRRGLAERRLPNMAALLREGSLLQMSSVHPWVSSVAWTTLQTGVNPGKHGIFGFIDRDPATMKTYIPLAHHIRYPALWDLLSRAGKRVVVLNVPVTYPVNPVNGVMVAGFLAPKLSEKAVYPPSLLPVLEEQGYRVDSDPQLAHRDRSAALEDLTDALQRRLRLFLHLLDKEPWDFFLGVLMETDRLHHFFFDVTEHEDHVHAPGFWELYKLADAFIGQVRERLGGQDVLMLMSDHGSCTIKQEVFFNRWLVESGHLLYSEEPAARLEQLHPNAAAYALDPARIFVNLKGRERNGRVEKGTAYERLRDELVAAAESLRVPHDGTTAKPVLKAFRREDIYSGPLVDRAADIVLAPTNGFDPKGAFYKDTLVRREDALVGMHTYDDAFVYVNRNGSQRSGAQILDVAPTVLAAMGQPIPSEYDGKPLV